MCGRFAQYTPVNDLMEEFEIDQNLSDTQGSFNIAPGSEISVIVFDGKKKLVKMKWGYIPSWLKDNTRPGMINARAEGINDKPYFRTSYKQRRCLIVADGFYEWKGSGKEKVPVYIKLKSGKPFALAGVYDFFTDSQGRKIGTCAIITTSANDLIKDIHNRMPVIIKKENHGIYLDAVSDEQLTLPFLSPYPPEEMELFEVSKDVNSPKNNSPELIKKIIKKD